MCHARVYAGVNMLQEMDQLNRSTKYVHISRPREYINGMCKRGNMWHHVESPDRHCSDIISFEFSKVFTSR